MSRSPHTLPVAHYTMRSLTDGFDTSTASGRLSYHVLGAVAEFKREVIKERTAAMKAAKKRRHI